MSSDSQCFLPGTHTGCHPLQSNALMWCWVFSIVLNGSLQASQCRFHTHKHTHTVTDEWTGEKRYIRAHAGNTPETHQRRGNTPLYYTLRGMSCMWRAGMFDLDHSSGKEVGSESLEAGARPRPQTCHFFSYSNFGLADYIYRPNIVFLCVWNRELSMNEMPLSFRLKAKTALPTRQLPLDFTLPRT